MGKIKPYQITKSLAAAGNYAAEDVLSESATAGTAWHFENIVSENGGTGKIHQVTAHCSTTALTPRIVLYPFNISPVSGQFNDNVANTAVVDGDIRNVLCPPIDLPPMRDYGGDSESWATPSTSGNLPVVFQCLNSSKDIYIIAVTKDAITGEAVGMNLTLTFWIEEL